MALVHDRCICIRKVEYSETSQILTLFSRANGRVQLIAKGAHRRTKVGASKFDGGLDLLDTGEAVFSLALDRALSPLTEWHLTDGHLDLRRDLRAIHLGLYAAELVTWLFEEHDAHPTMFDRLSRLLDELATPAREFFLSFQFDLLREAGYMPRLSSCAICRNEVRTDPLYFSAASGSVICRNCEGTVPDRMEIDARLIGIMRTVLATPSRLPILTRHQTDPINTMLANHVEQVLQKRLRMPKCVLAKGYLKSPTTRSPLASSR